QSLWNTADAVFRRCNGLGVGDNVPKQSHPDTRQDPETSGRPGKLPTQVARSHVRGPHGWKGPGLCVRAEIVRPAVVQAERVLIVDGRRTRSHSSEKQSCAGVSAHGKETAGRAAGRISARLSWTHVAAAQDPVDGTDRSRETPMHAKKEA